MATYLVLYSSPVSPAEMMASMTPEQAKSGMDLWMAWAQRCGDAIIDLGAPLAAGSHVENGAASASASQVAGYSLMRADSLDALNAIVTDHPHLQTPGGSIEVLESLPMPGM